jgi:adenylate cyclase
LLDRATDMGELIAAELVDQVRFTPHAEFTSHHPLIRTMAYRNS